MVSKFKSHIYIYIYIWVNYNDLTVLPHWNHGYEGNHPQMALIQVSEISLFTQMYIYIYKSPGFSLVKQTSHEGFIKGINYLMVRSSLGHVELHE